MDKFSELKAAAMAATPGPWEWFTSNSMARLSSTPSGKDGDVLSAFRASDGVPCVSVSQHDMAFIAAVNPVVVLALLAELEAKDKRIAELERTTEGVDQLAIDGGWTARGMSEYTKLMEDRLEKWQELASNQCIKINELQTKLATPVRLPQKNTGWDRDDGEDCWNNAIDACAKELRAAGFKCEGDE